MDIDSAYKQSIRIIERKQPVSIKILRLTTRMYIERIYDNGPSFNKMLADKEFLLNTEGTGTQVALNKNQIANFVRENWNKSKVARELQR